MEKEYNIYELVPTNLRLYVAERRENGMFLSDYQIQVLKRSGLFYQKYKTVKELLFDIEVLLNSVDSSSDLDSLEQIANELSEREYYSHTNQ